MFGPVGRHANDASRGLWGTNLEDLRDSVFQGMNDVSMARSTDYRKGACTKTISLPALLVLSDTGN